MTVKNCQHQILNYRVVLLLAGFKAANNFDLTCLAREKIAGLKIIPLHVCRGSHHKVTVFWGFWHHVISYLVLRVF